MNRRTFLCGLTLGTLAAPFVGEAQQTKRIPVVGILTSGLCPTDPEAKGTGGFVVRLRDLGHVEGKNLVVECRRSDGTAERYRDLAAELARLNPNAILAVGSAAVQAAKSVTTHTPIVAVDMETDPVGSGLAASLARPGGNVTGVFLDLPEVSGKRLELLKAMLPGLSRAALLSDAGLDPTPVRATEHAARLLGVELHMARVRSHAEVPAAMATAVRQGARALIVLNSPLFVTHEKLIADLALRHRLPSVGMLPRFVEMGGLMSYGPDVNRLFLPAASTVDRILRGAAPGEVPIQRPTRFYLVVNRTTAKALDLTIPQTVLVRADQVIE